MEAEQLIISICQGVNPAFKQFYDLFKERVYNTCLSHLQNESEAEEATQDVFIEIYKNACSFQQMSAASTWVYRIAVNKCIDRIRYNKRQKRFGFISSIFNNDTGELQHDPVEFNHPGIVFENKDKAAKLFAAIAQLPDNQQSAFILKQVEGLPQKEVAKIMDMTEKAVESLLQRAKGNLRKSLEGFYNESKD